MHIVFPLPGAAVIGSLILWTQKIIVNYYSTYCCSLVVVEVVYPLNLL